MIVEHQYCSGLETRRLYAVGDSPGAAGLLREMEKVYGDCEFIDSAINIGETLARPRFGYLERCVSVVSTIDRPFPDSFYEAGNDHLGLAIYKLYPESKKIEIKIFRRGRTIADPSNGLIGLTVTESGRLTGQVDHYFRCDSIEPLLKLYPSLRNPRPYEYEKGRFDAYGLTVKNHNPIRLKYYRFAQNGIDPLGLNEGELMLEGMI